MIRGDLSRNAWATIRAVGPDCRIREKTSCSYSNDLPSCIGIESIFSVVNSGAQAGCGPIFLNLDKAILERRVRLLFKGQYDELIDEIAVEVRGGREKATQLVSERGNAIARMRASFDHDAIRPILAHFQNGRKPKKRGFCYFDARIWLFPRTDRVSPDTETVWDCKPKLIFRDMYDPGDKDIIAAVETAGSVVDNHLFNGGVYVAVVKSADGVSNLTAAGEALRAKFPSDEEFLSYVSSVLNSPQVQEWGHLNPLERVKIPTEIEARLACRMAKIEQSKSLPWSRANEAATTRKRQSVQIADLFGTVLDALEKAA